MTIKEKILGFWAGLDSLEDRVYYVVLAVGITASVVSAIMSIPQGLGSLAVAGSLICTVVMVALWVVGRRWHKENVCRVILVYVVNLLLFPINFFVCGGLTSGMVMFYLIGLFNVAISLRGKQRVVAFIISLIGMELSMTLGRYVPGLIDPLDEWQQFQDMKITLFLTGATLVGMTALILKAFEDERRRAGELAEFQRMLSIRDPMTGLFNRRELFRRLEALFDASGEAPDRSGWYVAMLDVDGFKSLNDTYGHLFGDEVLATSAKIMSIACRADDGELAARYGGEEFMLVFRAANPVAAFQRVDSIRRKIAQQTWEEVPGLTVTVSGGVVRCSDCEQVSDATSGADQLLYKAKGSGKNRICQVLENAPPPESDP